MLLKEIADDLAALKKSQVLLLSKVRGAAIRDEWAIDMLEMDCTRVDDVHTAAKKVLEDIREMTRLIEEDKDAE